MCSCQEQRRHRNVTSLRHDFRKPHLRLIVLNFWSKNMLCDFASCVTCDVIMKMRAIVFWSVAMPYYESGLTGGRMDRRTSGSQSERVRHKTLQCHGRRALELATHEPGGA